MRARLVFVQCLHILAISLISIPRPRHTPSADHMVCVIIENNFFSYDFLNHEHGKAILSNIGTQNRNTTIVACKLSYKCVLFMKRKDDYPVNYLCELFSITLLLINMGPCCIAIMIIVHRRKSYYWIVQWRDVTPKPTLQLDATMLRRYDLSMHMKMVTYRQCLPVICFVVAHSSSKMTGTWDGLSVGTRQSRTVDGILHFVLREAS